MSRFAQELYEIAANEVTQHNVVRGIMAKTFSDAGGDEKKAIAYYMEYRAAQLAQEAREELRQKRRAATGAARQRAISKFRPLGYGALSAVLWLFGLFALLSGALVLFHALDQLTQGEPGVLGNVGPIVCGYLAVKCVKAATRK
jgi:hypothetical protein